MQRFTEKDEYGGEIKYAIPEVKRCPICRREVVQEEIAYIKGLLEEHPEIDDGGYKQNWNFLKGWKSGPREFKYHSGVTFELIVFFL